MNKPERSETAVPAVGFPVDCPVGRPVPERVSVGDAVECDLREPYPHVSRWRLLTPEAAAHANTLLATPGSGWRKTPNYLVSGTQGRRKPT